MSLCPTDPRPGDAQTRVAAMLASSLPIDTNAVRLERFAIEFCTGACPGHRLGWVAANAPIGFVVRSLAERTARHLDQMTVGPIAGPDGGVRPGITGLYALQESGHLRLLGVITTPIDHRQFDAAIAACAREAFAGLA